MAKLTGLPNEIIVEILKNVSSVSDIDAFCLTSKDIRAVARPILVDHMSLKMRCTNWRNTVEPGLMASGPPAALLKDILDNPRVALYVNSLHINEYEKSGAAFLTDGAVMRTLSKSVQDCAFIPEAEKYLWMDKINAGNEDPVIGLLLFLLPNLTRLRLEADDLTLTPDMVKRICMSDTPMALTKLRTVELDGHAEWVRINTGFFKSFTLLPAIERLSMKGAELLYDELDPELKAIVRSHKSPIRHLSFEGCEVCPAMLLDILAASDCLATFTYHEFFEEEPENELKPRQIRDALLANAKETLEYLKLELEEPSFLESYRGFRVLETVDIPVEYLQNQHLARMLPRSIKTLTLHDGSSDLRIFESFLSFHNLLGPVENFSVAAFEGVPNLKRINYEFARETLASEGYNFVYHERDAFNRMARCGIQLVLSWEPPYLHTDSVEVLNDQDSPWLSELYQAISLRQQQYVVRPGTGPWYTRVERGNNTSGGGNTVPH